MQKKTAESFKTLQIDQIASDKLSDLISKIEELLKPYQYTFAVRTEKKNNDIKKVKLETEIFL